MKNRPAGGELFLDCGQMDRRTGRYEEANSSFLQFSKVLKNEKVLFSGHIHLCNLSSARPYVRTASFCSSVCDLVSTAKTYVGFS